MQINCNKNSRLSGFVTDKCFQISIKMKLSFEKIHSFSKSHKLQKSLNKFIKRFQNSQQRLSDSQKKEELIDILFISL